MPRSIYEEDNRIPEKGRFDRARSRVEEYASKLRRKPGDHAPEPGDSLPPLDTGRQRWEARSEYDTGRGGQRTNDLASRGVNAFPLASSSGGSGAFSYPAGMGSDGRTEGVMLQRQYLPGGPGSYTGSYIMMRNQSAEDRGPGMSLGPSEYLRANHGAYSDSAYIEQMARRQPRPPPPPQSGDTRWSGGSRWSQMSHASSGERERRRMERESRESSEEGRRRDEYRDAQERYRDRGY